MPLQRDSRRVWEELRAHLCASYAEPDIEGFRLALVGATVHYFPGEQPLWLLMLGISSSGKTEIVAHALEALPDAFPMGSLSGRSINTMHPDAKGGILARAKRQLWIFKEFSTALTGNPTDRGEVMSRLREIYDKSFTSVTGLGVRHWDGHISIIAMATPDIEEEYRTFAHLGERFMLVRWREADQLEVAERSRETEQRQEKILRETARLARELVVNRWTSQVYLDNDEMRRLDHACVMLARLRRPVKRHRYERGRPIASAAKAEGIGRITRSVSQVIRASALLDQRLVPEPDDFRLADRMILDTIPADYREILRWLPPGATVPYADIASKCELGKTTAYERLEELVFLKILVPDERKHGKEARYTDDFRSLLKRTGLSLHSAPAKVVPIERPLGNT